MCPVLFTAHGAQGFLANLKPKPEEPEPPFPVDNTLRSIAYQFQVRSVMSSETKERERESVSTVRAALCKRAVVEP